MMIQSYSMAALTAALALAGSAAPLDKSKIAGDARWLVHLDLEAFRTSALGSHIVKDLLEPKLQAAEEAKKLNLSVNLQNISSITAYGPSFEKTGDGVLMIETTADVKKDIDTAAGVFMLMGGSTNSPLVTVHQEPYLLYTLNSNVFIAPNIDHRLVVAKSRAQIEQAEKVLMGKGETLKGSKAFSGYPETPHSYFFVGVAEGFAEAGAMPPQAQVLKEARGGRLVIGEREKDLFVNLVFRGKNEEATSKIQQVLQGVVALVSLSQEDEELTRLANGTKINSEGENVIVNVQFPVSKAIERIDEESKDQPSQKAHPKKPAKNQKMKKKAKAAPEPHEEEIEKPDQEQTREDSGGAAPVK